MAVKIGVSANKNAIYIADGLFIDAADIANHQQQLGAAVIPGDIKYINISRDWYGYDDNLTDTDDWVWAKHPGVPEIVYGFGPLLNGRIWISPSSSRNSQNLLHGKGFPSFR